MCDAKTIKAIDEGKAMVLKKWQVIVGLAIVLLSNFAFAINWKTTTDITVKNHELRLSRLEKKDKTNHDLLLEIKFNLKAFVEKQGFNYQELGSVE